MISAVSEELWLLREKHPKSPSLRQGAKQVVESAAEPGKAIAALVHAVKAIAGDKSIRCLLIFTLLLTQY